MKVIGNFGVLISKAKALGHAKKHGTIEDIQKAQSDHDSYRDICLAADEVSLGLTHGQLANIMTGKNQ